MVATLQERAKTLVELVACAEFYLTDVVTLDSAAARKHLKPEIGKPLRVLREHLARAGGWNVETIHARFNEVTEQFGLKLGQIAQPVRVAVTGGTSSPGIFEVLDVLGQERTLARLDRAIERIGEGSPASTQAAGTR